MHRPKHQPLPESVADEKDKVIAGVSYTVRYVGEADILKSEGKGKGCTDEAIVEIYQRYSNKTKFKSLARRELFVSANCVSLIEPSVGAILFRYQTVKITFCNTSAEHPNAFVLVVKDSPSSPFKAHVVHCESAAKANEIFTMVSQALKVRSALYHAKQLDKAGWANGWRKARPEEARDEEPTTEIRENGHSATDGSADANNNTFGKIACASSASQSNSWNELERASDVQNGVRYANGGSNGSQYAAEFSLARVLLSRSPSRERSHSMPYNNQNPWAENTQNGDCIKNAQMDLSRGLLHNAPNGTSDDDDNDDFSMLARERRSLSMSLVRPVS